MNRLSRREKLLNAVGLALIAAGLILAHIANEPVGTIIAVCGAATIVALFTRKLVYKSGD